MSDLTLPAASSLVLPHALRAEPRFIRLALVLSFLIVPTFIAGLLDPRQIAGISVWDKPLKFEVALAVYFATLSFFAGFVPPSLLSGPRYRLYAQSIVLATIGEMGWLIGAAVLGVPSHFNTTDLGATIYRTMGVLAIWLTSVSFVYARAIWRDRSMRLSPALRDGLALGLGLVLPLTLITAGAMSAYGSHHVGGLPTDTNGLPFMGWSRSGGDLRVAHFLATHTMHVIPLAAWVSSLALGGDRRWPVWVFTAAYVALVGWAFAGAWLGRPFLPF